MTKPLQLFSCRSLQLALCALIVGISGLGSDAIAEKGDRLVPANPLGARKNWDTDLQKTTPAPAPAKQTPQAPAVAPPAPVTTPAPAPAQPAPQQVTKPAPAPQPAAAPQPASAPLSKEEQQTAAIKKIDNFFNTITYLEGRFLQTDSGNNKTAGNFYVKRPGRIRFDYDAPSNLRIVSDGKWLSIEDHDLSTFDRYPLETTPFKLLLKKDVNLVEDAEILDFFLGDDLIIVTVVDKQEADSGKIKLFFTNPEVQLKEWIITDPQGLDTRVELKNVVSGKRIKPGFFVVTDDTMQAFPR